MSMPISVVVPVGPMAHHRRWLNESIQSIVDQTCVPDELIIIDDGSDEGIYYSDVQKILGNKKNEISTLIYQNPCNLGVVASLNIGVAIAKHNLVLLSCADDKLLPNCIEKCMDAWNQEQESLAYYYLGVQYSDGREQNVACGAAMVTKDLWRYTGGFPAQCSVGAADHIFLSMLISGSNGGYSKAKIIQVSRDITYWYRVHDNIETSKNIWPAIEAVKNRFNEEWRPRE